MFFIEQMSDRWINEKSVEKNDWIKGNLFLFKSGLILNHFVDSSS